jgi:filamentous hemagglutinin family protein
MFGWRAGALEEKMKNRLFFSLGLSFRLVFCVTQNLVYANNLSINNVSMEDRDATNNTVVVEFDISWFNSWRNTVNHDAVWIVLKITSGSSIPIHGLLETAGTDPSGTSPGSNADIEIYIPSD